MNLLLRSGCATQAIAAVLWCMMAAAQAQMQTPPPNVPPSARPVNRPTPPLLPSRAPPAPAQIGSAPQMEPAAPSALSTPSQSPTEQGQPQLTIPLGRPKEASSTSPVSPSPPVAATPAAAAPPARAASRGKARAARNRTPTVDCATEVSASRRSACRDAPGPSSSR